VGIICLTRDNLTEPWLLFEAGALSKTKDAYVCTLLLDVAHTDIEQPLAQFQHTTVAKPDLLALLHTLNLVVRNAGGRSLTEIDFEEVFELFWPGLETMLKAIPRSARTPARSTSADGVGTTPRGHMPLSVPSVLP